MNDPNLPAIVGRAQLQGALESANLIDDNFARARGRFGHKNVGRLRAQNLLRRGLVQGRGQPGSNVRSPTLSWTSNKIGMSEPVFLVCSLQIVHLYVGRERHS